MEEDRFTFGKTVEVKIGDKTFEAEPKEVSIEKRASIERKELIKDKESKNVFDSLLDKALSKEEELIKDAIRERYSDTEVEFLEDMIEEEKFDVVRTWFNTQDCYIEIEPRHYCFVKKLYIQDSLAEVWAV